MILTACGMSSQAPPDSPSPVAPAFSVLVFSRTEGFRHDSIPSGIAAIRQQGATRGFSVEASEDSSAFTDDSLARFKAVVFLSTTGDVLNPQQQDAFERFIRRGGGFAGVHGIRYRYDWPFYGGLVGVYFAGHPDIQNATVQIEDRGHPSTSSLPQAWMRRDAGTTSSGIRGAVSPCSPRSMSAPTPAVPWRRIIPSCGLRTMKAGAPYILPAAIRPRAFPKRCLSSTSAEPFCG